MMCERESGVAVLLTVAVSADPAFQVAVGARAERVADYRRAFHWWQKMASARGWRLLVVESSGCGEDEFISLMGAQESVEFYAYTPNPGSSARGKGAVEADMVDLAVERLMASGFAGTLYKVTGRLIVGNAATLFQDVGDAAFVCRGLMDFRRVDVRCFGGSVSVWRDELFGLSGAINENSGGDYGDLVASRLVDARDCRRISLGRFAMRPYIEGRSGTRGNSYGGRWSKVTSRLLGPLEGLLAGIAAKKSV